MPGEKGKDLLMQALTDNCDVGYEYFTAVGPSKITAVGS
jgi:hypothetical protein